MLVTEFLEFGDLWRALPLTNAAGQRIFAWHKRCVETLWGSHRWESLADRLCILLHVAYMSRSASRPICPAFTLNPHAPPALPACLPASGCRGRRVLYDVAKGLTYLHHRRIVHLDLKSGALKRMLSFTNLIRRLMAAAQRLLCPLLPAHS